MEEVCRLCIISKSICTVFASASRLSENSMPLVQKPWPIHDYSFVLILKKTDPGENQISVFDEWKNNGIKA